MNIRPMRITDCRGVLACLERTNLLDAALTHAKLCALIHGNPACQFVLADTQDQIYGCCIGTFDNGLYGYVYIVAVDSAQQRHGWATQLVEQLLEAFRRKGATHVYAHVKQGNTAGLALCRTAQLACSQKLGVYVRTLVS